MPPLLFLTVQSDTEGDWLKLDQALQQLTTEDQSIGVESDEDGGGVVVSGMGELHLEIVIDRLMREFGAKATVSHPRVVHKAILTRPADGEMKYAKQIGGRGQYGHVKIHVQPGEPGTGVVLTNGIVGGAIPNEFIAPIEEGLRHALARGMFEGFRSPVDDVSIEICDGSYHDVDSSATAFMIAGVLAFHDAAAKAKPVLLEPVMRVEVTVPAGHVDDVRRDLLARRGSLRSQHERDGMHITGALVPLSEMLGYAAYLRERTDGRGTFVMQLDHYQPMQRTEGDTDRNSFVGAPPKPTPPLKSSRVALPEPDDDIDDSLQGIR